MAGPWQGPRVIPQCSTRSRARDPKPGERQGWQPERTQGASGTASQRALPAPAYLQGLRFPRHPPEAAAPSLAGQQPCARPTPEVIGVAREALREDGGHAVIGPPQQPMRWQILGAAPVEERRAAPGEEELLLSLPGAGHQAADGGLVQSGTGQVDKRSDPRPVGDRGDPRYPGLVPAAGGRQCDPPLYFSTSTVVLLLPRTLGNDAWRGAGRGGANRFLGETVSSSVF